MLDIKINDFITDFTKDGKCSSCGSCCSDCLPMSEYEVKKVKSYIKAHNIKEQRHNAMQGVDMTCPFRDEAHRKCLIYQVRPAICKQFMCNHTIEDIQQSKMRFHKYNRVVFMRSEFYGNNEDVNFFLSALKEG